MTLLAPERSTIFEGRQRPDDVPVPAAKGVPESAVEYAQAFLLAELGAGPRPAVDVIEVARRAGVSTRTLKRGKARAGVRSRRKGFGANGGWSWELTSKGGQGAGPTRPVSVWCVHCNFWKTASSSEEGRAVHAAHMADEHPDVPTRGQAS